MAAAFSDWRQGGLLSLSPNPPKKPLGLPAVEAGLRTRAVQTNEAGETPAEIARQGRNGRRRRTGAKAPPQIRLFCMAQQVVSQNAAGTPNGG
jgi:hypothetical protein